MDDDDPPPSKHAFLSQFNCFNNDSSSVEFNDDNDDNDDSTLNDENIL